MWEKPKIKEGKLTKWNWMVQGVDKLELGENIDIGAFTYINAKEGCKIGNNVQIGSHCSIYTQNTIDRKYGRIEIGENTCIGTHSTVLPNVKIGKNCLIGAYSLIKEDIPDYTRGFGIPFKKRGYKNVKF